MDLPYHTAARGADSAMPLSLPSRALVMAAFSAIAGCQNRQAAVGSPASSPTVSTAPGFATVTFERTPCFGTCPVYKVTVMGDGVVRFDGTRNVDSVGTYNGRISAAAVVDLRRAFEDAKYWTLASKYDQSTCPAYGTDAARILTSIITPTQSKSIEHDLGCGGQAPAQLADLYRRFDTIVGTARWIGNR
jgi:hypothetical protein